MFIKRLTSGSISDFSEQIAKLKSEMLTADAILVGTGAGLSAAAGMDYSGERFMRLFSDFYKKYGIQDMYSGGFYPFETREEYWAWWSRHIWNNRYAEPAGEPYLRLLELLKGRDYFVLSTNVDHQLQLAGFDRQRLFCTQGDYGLFQCANDGCKKTFDNKESVRQMLARQENMRIPTQLIPRCPYCGAELTPNLRCDDSFVQDESWYEARGRYKSFLSRHEGGHILYLELGVGWNTPVIIKYPFWQMTAQNPNAVYISVNSNDACCPEEICARSVCISADILNALRKAAGSV